MTYCNIYVMLFIWECIHLLYLLLMICKTLEFKKGVVCFYGFTFSMSLKLLCVNKKLWFILRYHLITRKKLMLGVCNFQIFFIVFESWVVGHKAKCLYILVNVRFKVSNSVRTAFFIVGQSKEILEHKFYSILYWNFLDLHIPLWILNILKLINTWNKE